MILSKKNELKKFFLVSGVTVLFFITPLEASSMNFQSGASRSRASIGSLPSLNSTPHRRFAATSPDCEELLRSFTESGFSRPSSSRERQKPIVAKLPNPNFGGPSKPSRGILLGAEKSLNETRKSLKKTLTISGQETSAIVEQKPETKDKKLPSRLTVSPHRQEKKRDVRVFANPKDSDFGPENPDLPYNRQLDRLNTQEFTQSKLFNPVRNVKKLALIKFKEVDARRFDNSEKAWKTFTEKFEVTQNKVKNQLLGVLESLKFPTRLLGKDAPVADDFTSINDLSLIKFLQELGFKKNEVEKIQVEASTMSNAYYEALTQKTGMLDLSNFFKSAEGDQAVGSTYLESLFELLCIHTENAEAELAEFNKSEKFVIDFYPDRLLYGHHTGNRHEIWEKYKERLKLLGVRKIEQVESSYGFRRRLKDFVINKQGSLSAKVAKYRDLRTQVGKRLMFSRLIAYNALYLLEDRYKIQTLNLDSDNPKERLMAGVLLAFANSGHKGYPGFLQILLNEEVRRLLEDNRYSKDPDFKPFFSEQKDFEKEFRTRCLPVEFYLDDPKTI